MNFTLINTVKHTYYSITVSAKAVCLDHTADIAKRIIMHNIMQ